MAMQIYTNGAIEIDGKDTGLGVSQQQGGTAVYTRESITAAYVRHSMPHPRYALSTDSPASGNPGRTQFEADVRALLATL